MGYEPIQIKNSSCLTPLSEIASGRAFRLSLLLPERPARSEFLRLVA